MAGLNFVYPPPFSWLNFVYPLVKSCIWDIIKVARNPAWLSHFYTSEKWAKNSIFLKIDIKNKPSDFLTLKNGRNLTIPWPLRMKFLSLGHV